MYQLLHWCKMRCPYTTHFAPMLQLAIVKNQNLPIVTLVQNVLLLIQRILHQYNNLNILIFFLLQNALEMSTHFASKKKLMQNALIWYIHQNVPIVTLVQNVPIQRILHQSNNWHLLKIKFTNCYIGAKCVVTDTTHFAPM